MEAVAAGDEVASDLQRGAAGAVGHPRLVGEDVVQADLARGVDGFRAGRGAPVHEVPGDLGLPVDRHGLAGQRPERDAMAYAVDADLHAVVHETVAMCIPAANPGLVKEIRVICSITPARTRPSTCSAVCRSRLTLSMPFPVQAGFARAIVCSPAGAGAPDDG